MVYFMPKNGTERESAVRDRIYEFSDPAVMSEPHDFFDMLRHEAPVAKVRGPDGRIVHFVTAYRLIEDITKRPEDFSSDIAHLLFAGGSMSAEVEQTLRQDYISAGLLLITDDPDHKRHRALVNAAFAQGRVADLSPVIERIVDELIDDFIETGECDFVNQFAVLLPTYMIADILGMAREDYPKVRLWSDAVIGIVSRMGDADAELAAAKMVLEFRRFILAQLEKARRSPGDDLVSSLVQVRIDGVAPLEDSEIAGVTFEIAVAGNETTRNTLMSGLVRLLDNPAELEALRADPSLTASAVEEMLRFETPATSMWRVATRDAEVGGVMISRGAEVLLRFDAANRDPAVFEDPHAFRVDRKNALRHIAFGAPGIHRCLGQMLARKEMAIAWPKLLSRLRNIEIVGDKSDTAYWPGLLHRGITSLHIRFDPGEKLDRRRGIDRAA